jgi:hypothetical protein
LYRILWVSQQEAILVLVNITGQEISSYTLGVDQSSLAEGIYTPAAILGSGEFATLADDSSGGFGGYIPFVEIPPYSIYILQLQQKSP